jgi:hypothetical protein
MALRRAIIEYTVQAFAESIKYLRQSSTGMFSLIASGTTTEPLAEAEAQRGWKSAESKINDCLSEIERAVKHLNDIMSYSRVNIERQVKDLSNRHGPVVQPEEPTSFPLQMINRPQNLEFYGRQEELMKINAFLDNRTEDSLRTYTIYGRRGVGKTDIALEYAYTNPARFEAIFWVQCETALAIRQSFTDMAVALCLPKADRNGQYDRSINDAL